ncbi:tetratricopeptide repeat protein [Desulfomonile tiedjei]|uniref:tetratricopeptide repeat protein n=1 Tax=Desulfomonile tiedjei TaxID=2358 RepID=UPI0012FC332A|nr:tetratricopeptide repeat protein [Desulfomonile tiedjei]
MLNYPALDGPFHYDSMLLEKNQELFQSGGLRSVIKIFPQRPLTMASFYANYRFAGLIPYYFRVVNVLILGLAGVAVTLLVRLLLGTPALNTHSDSRQKDVLSILLGLLYVVHPVQSVLVIYIWQRTALLCNVFFLVALVSYVASRLNRIPAAVGYPLSLLFFLLAMVSKENAIILPAIVLLTEFALFGTGFRKLIRIGAIVGGVTVLVLAMMSILERPHGAGEEASGIMATILKYYDESGLTFSRVLVNQSRILFLYVSTIFVPTSSKLQIITPQILVNSITESAGAAAWMLAAGTLIVSGLVLLKRSPLTGLGILFFVAALLPESFLVPQYLFIVYRASLPMIGLLLVVADICLFLYKSFSRAIDAGFMRKAVSIGLIGSIVLLGVTTRLRAAEWSDPLTFWKQAVQLLPPLSENIEKEGTLHTLNLLILNMIRKGSSLEEIADYERKALSLRHRPETVNVVMGNGFYARGDVPLAEAAYKKSLQIRPDFVHAHVALGGLLSNQGRNAEALQHYERAVQLEPGNARYRHYLGVVMLKMGNYQGAAESFHKATALDPYAADSCYQLAKALLEMGKQNEAVTQFQKTIHLNPGHAAAHTDLGVLSAMSGHLQEAVTHFRSALRAKPGDPLAADNLETALRQLRDGSDSEKEGY